MNYKNKSCRMLIDTGAAVSLIKVDNIFEKDLTQNKFLNFKGIGNGNIKSLGTCNLSVDFGNSDYLIEFHVINKEYLSNYDGIIGNDVLKDNAFIVDYDRKTLRRKNENISLNFGKSVELAKEKSPRNKKSFNENINFEGQYLEEIPPRCEVFRLVNITDGQGNQFPENSEVVILSAKINGILFPDCVTLVRNDGKGLVKVINVDEDIHYIELKAIGYPLEDFNTTESDCEDADLLEINTFEMNDGRIEEILSNLRTDHMNEEEADSIFAIAKEYCDIFSLKGDKLTTTSLVEHKIRVKENSEPIYTKSYRYPKIHEKEVDNQIKNLKEDGIIRDSKSPWNSPLWVVPKKRDASKEMKWRIVIDYRRLNEITIADNYPLPNISEILDQLGNSKYFSVLDLTSGFHQIPVAEEDVEKTAFSTPYGHYEFTKMPFGLKNAPACFQRLMNTVLSGLQGVKCFVYLDDIVIYGKTLHEHNQKLIEVFEQLRRSNLKLQMNKCEFLKKDVAYLGHVITEKGVKPDPQKVEALDKFKPPNNQKEIKSFLGMIGYYRKFIKDFSKKAFPLNKLLKKNSDFKWTAEQQNSFLELKEALRNVVILQYPDYNKKFIITTDASNYGLGAVLSQESNGKDLPLQFISRSLSKSEKNYSTTEKECLAIVWAVKVLRPYVYGRNFVIRSDHKPLQWLFNVKDPGSRLVRWRLKLEEYDYSIEYKKGCDNVVADELSRNINILEEIDENEDTDIDVEKEVNEILNNRTEEVTNETLIEEVVDGELKTKILKEYHEGLVGGHCGQKATINKIKQKYNWKGLNRDVITYISKCVACQTEKIDRHPSRNPMTIVTSANHALEKIAIDLTGPYITKDKIINKYGLTIQDDLSKFIKFVPIESKEASIVAKALVENWILIFGVPKIILSDNGTEFCNSLMKELSEIFGFKNITTSVAYPQSNGSVERAHARLTEYIRTVSREGSDSSKNWDEYMKYASFCYNTTQHSSTGFTPYELVFGRTANKPSDVDYEEIQTTHDYSTELRMKLLAMEIKAKARLLDNKEKSKVRYDQKLGPKLRDIRSGDRVYVKEASAGKLDPKWSGPYVVSSVEDNNIIVKRNGKLTIYNKSRVKLFIGYGRSQSELQQASTSRN